MENIRSEGNLSKFIVDKCLNATVHVSRVESPETSAGIPDLSIAFDMKESWLELKTAPKMRLTQYIWIRDAVFHGRNVWVVWYDEDLDLIRTIKGVDAVKHKLHLTTAKTDWRRPVVGVWMPEQFEITKFLEHINEG
jgi:hypothetical protein